MVSAGASAAQQAQRLSALAQSHLKAAEEARADAGKFAAAAIAERRLAKRLTPLGAHGFHILPDRKWPGSRNAQLDLIVVGPSGVWIVDSKHWNDFSVAAGHMYRDQADVTDDVLRLADVAYDAEDAFTEVGLAPGEVRPLLVMEGRKGRLGEVGSVEVVGAEDVHKHLAARGRRLTTTQVEQVLAVAMRYFPAYVGAQVEAPQAIVPEPALDELPDDLLDDGALLSEDEVLEAMSEAELAAPVEDWMTFLHPSQAKLVRRSFNGPARIRGSAGTGKTVVGLHRAAYLARMYPNQRVLFTTFVKTLPAVMSNLLARMAPDAAERVDFVHVHGFASKVLRERGIRINLQGREAQGFWRKAWATLPEELKSRLIARAGSSSADYWQEEVQDVIKGRGLTTFEAYADCARPGRMVRLNMDDRRAVWALYQSYEGMLRARRCARLPRHGAARGRGVAPQAVGGLRGGDRRRGAGPVPVDGADAALAGRRRPGCVHPDRRRPAEHLPGRLRAVGGWHLARRSRRGAGHQLPQHGGDPGVREPADRRVGVHRHRRWRYCADCAVGCPGCRCPPDPARPDSAARVVPDPCGPRPGAGVPSSFCGGELPG